MLHRYTYLTRSEEDIITKYWPSPLTMILRARPGIFPRSLLSNDKIAVRIPQNQLIQKISSYSGVPLVGTSANISGTNLQNINFFKFQRLFPYIKNFICSTNMVNNIYLNSSKPSTILKIGRGNLFYIMRKGAKNIKNHSTHIL